jgi:aryl-alcohol dehydrogenase-like predicted oxidoreductase
MAWSSQARGFFVRGRPDFTADRSLVTCWYSDDNFERLERAKKLAAELGVLPTNVALAYVLCQPFPTYALVGPQSLVETRTTLPALNLQLTPQQLRWLNLEE